MRASRPVRSTWCGYSNGDGCSEGRQLLELPGITWHSLATKMETEYIRQFKIDHEDGIRKQPEKSYEQLANEDFVVAGYAKR
jgi:hypothetical protein